MSQLEQLQAELAQVRSAISAALTGSEMEIQDGQTKRRIKRQDLQVLLRRQSELELGISRLDPTAGSRGPSYAMAVDSNSCLNR